MKDEFIAEVAKVIHSFKQKNLDDWNENRVEILEGCLALFAYELAKIHPDLYLDAMEIIGKQYQAAVLFTAEDINEFLNYKKEKEECKSFC